ncbi:hypothetical protein SAMD00019534_087580, partial [Acytostelium subglobosum LB1]|uniref:hypothetical protein n=1 Tax=Acytostelium subglobosum LB1 TaxID=1410327 RepID=UPI000644E187
ARNTLFRFFSHTLPINHIREKAACQLCGLSVTSKPYDHFFVHCCVSTHQNHMAPVL